jgi:hypothetical protein
MNYPAELLEAISILREQQSKLKYDHERKDLWDQIQDGYCNECGTPIAHGKECYCTRDD